MYQINSLARVELGWRHGRNGADTAIAARLFGRSAEVSSSRWRVGSLIIHRDTDGDHVEPHDAVEGDGLRAFFYRRFHSGQHGNLDLHRYDARID